MAKRGAKNMPSPDFTEHKQAEGMFKILADSSPIGIYIVQDGKFRYNNLRFQRYTGYSQEELIGMEPLSLVLPEDRNKAKENAAKMLKGERSSPYEYRTVSKAGKTRWIMETVASISYQGRRATFGNYMDITESRQAEEKHQTITKTALDGFWICNLQGRFLEVNNSYCNMVGYVREELLKMSISDIEAVEKNEDTSQHIKNIMDQGYDRFESRHRRKDGEIINVEISVNYLDAGEGQLFVFVRDITERKQAEEELRASRAQMKALLDGSPDRIRQVDRNLRIVWANKAALGNNPDAIGETCYKAYLNRDEPCKGCPCNKVFETGQIESGVIYQPNVRGIQGESYWEDIGVPLKNSEGEIIGAIQITRDITERKHAEEALRKSEENLRSLLDSMDDLVFVIDMKGIFRDYYQPSREEDFYIPPSEFLGRHFKDVLPPDVAEPLQSAITGVETSDKNQQFDYFLEMDGSVLWYEAGLSPIRGKSGEITGITGVCRDVTKRKRAEEEIQAKNKQLEAQNEQLQSQSEELVAQQQELVQKTRELEAASRAKSEFLSSMSHELRTPLNAVIGFSELMLDGVSGEINDEQRRCLRDILSSGRHLLSLINDVLDLSKVEKGRMDFKLENVNLTDAINGAAQVVKSILDENRHQLDVNVEEGLPQVLADRGRLRQVLLNLLSNAIKFTPPGGRLTIDTRREGDWCQVSVADNGIGIGQEDQERIFEAFIQVEASSEGKKEGTGLGLAITKQFVEAIGGRIWLESQYGKGSKFTFTLPLAKEGKPGLEGGGSKSGQSG